MIVKVLSSGSKGNCTYVHCGDKKFLIDCGISFLQIKNFLSTISVDINDLDYVLLTHSHNDHIKGLASLLKKTNITLCCPIEVYEDISKKIEINNYKIIDSYIILNNVEISSIHLSHDVECYGYIICYNEKSLVYITDTGYLNKKYYKKLMNKEIYIIESNHNEKMLMDGPYPFILKQRIISDKGHLSNCACGRIISKLIGPKTKVVYLAHISENNNTENLVLQEVKEELLINEVDFDNLIITNQYNCLEEVEI